MKVLIHYGKYNNNKCWAADTDEQLNVAWAMLFEKLDGEGCYTSLIPGVFYTNLMAARRGDMRQIQAILGMRNGRKGESWELLHATDTRNYILMPAPIPAPSKVTDDADPDNQSLAK